MLIKFLVTKISLLALLAISSLPVLFTQSASAAPTARVSSGTTDVSLSSVFINSVSGLGIGVSLSSPGRQRRGLLSFPIRTGQLDTVTLKGEIFHEGGIRLSNGAVAVDLLNFVIDSSAAGAPAPVLTGLVRLNNSVVGRIPLFTLTLKDPIVSAFGAFLSLPNTAVTLRPEAATALNQAFSVNAFTSGFNVGTAFVSAKLSYSFNTRSLRY